MLNKPIGVFDSGVGGISVLRELIKIMPTENYIYFGDSKNAPYGSKSTAEVRRLSLEAAKLLTADGAKAIVVACNTATSASVRMLREIYKDTVVVGIEPAVKPAVMYKKNSKILVLATPVTLREDKFHRLAALYERSADIISVPMELLADMIETGEPRENIKKYIKSELSSELLENTDSIVLGCTHYSFVSDIISEIAGEGVRIFDGGPGVAKETKRRLSEKNALNLSGGSIVYKSSLDAKKLQEFASYYIKNGAVAK